MAMFLGGLLGLLCIGVAIYPFVKYKYFPSLVIKTLENGRESNTFNDVMQNIRRLNLDYGLGSLPDETYHRQLNVYRNQAAKIIRNNDVPTGITLTSEMEQEILIARSKLERS
ncbi:MAG: hypothetical protein VX966_07635 [Chloroflexota bacterium]|nr:hypothetical protein [Chloroflexota bacterium]